MHIVISFTLISLRLIRCEFVNSYVRSDPDLLPSYDTIIFRDMIDVINEFENDLNSGFDLNFYSDSDGDDNIEDLLAEYQQFLDKARRQRINVDKVKNAYPITDYNRHTSHINNGQHFSYYSDIFTPFKTKVSNNLTKNPVKMTPSYDIRTSCYCEDNKFPCKCGCKQCIVHFKPLSVFNYPNNFNSSNAYGSQIIQKQRFSGKETFNDLTSDDKININIKVDVKLPKILENLANFYKIVEDEGIPAESFTRETLNPFSYINNNIPNIISFTPHLYKHVNEPTNKITVYKKKKNRSNKGGRRHKKKKIVTIHDVNYDSSSEKILAQNNETNIDELKNNGTLDENPASPQINDSTNINNTTIFQENVSIPLNATVKPIDKNDNNTDAIYLLFNISSTIDNATDDFSKIGNSIEQFDKTSTKSSQNNARLKRDVNESIINNTIIRNINKSAVIDDELLYWPPNLHNNSVANFKNITSLILERERKKSKLNMTGEVMHNNHTIALERAIFGDIDWNDMDAVVPVFISFMGKYTRGVLTFCSESSMCHSMNCEEKSCLHRVCTPQERFNAKGHCMGRNYTDSVAALESLMDLPSNIALEIVDILEDKLPGKMFGKATLCIKPKCVTFAVSKKLFVKAKCTFKELTTGHCQNIKIM